MRNARLALNGATSDIIIELCKRYPALLDVDLTGLPCGKSAEMAVKGYLSGYGIRRGRQMGRVVAAHNEEVVVDRLYHGFLQLRGTLPHLVEVLKARWSWTRRGGDAPFFGSMPGAVASTQDGGRWLALSEVERRYVERALAYTWGNKQEAARLLNPEDDRANY